jgi:hypothetical protein
VPLFSSLRSSSFVVGLEGGGVVIYKIQNPKKTFGVFQSALFSGRFFRVMVFYDDKKLINFLSKRKILDWYKINIV